MIVSSDGDSGGRVVPRVVASAPWVVVLLGVLTLVVIMVVALLSFRGPERASVSSAPPALVLPTPLDPTASEDIAAGRPTPTGVRSTQAAPTRTTRAASPPASRSARPRTSTTPQVLLAPSTPAGGTVTARYRPENDGSRLFLAELLVRNDTATAHDWRVELSFSGDVRGFQAYSRSGISVSSTGAGSYLLRGTRPLDAGARADVSVWVSRDGGGNRPERCTVNGVDCVID